MWLQVQGEYKFFNYYRETKLSEIQNMDKQSLLLNISLGNTIAKMVLKKDPEANLPLRSVIRAFILKGHMQLLNRQLEHEQ